MSKVFIHALYNDDDRLMDGAKKVREQGFPIKEVYSPFPVHGIDQVMGLKRTHLVPQYSIMGACFI
jgi:hypothetical protein